MKTKPIKGLLKEAAEWELRGAKHYLDGKYRMSDICYDIATNHRKMVEAIREGKNLDGSEW